MLRSLLQRLLRLTLAFPASLWAAPRVLDGTRYHLGVAALPEWQEFANSTPHGRDLHLTFRVSDEEAGRAATVFIRQRNVKATWHVALNGRRIGVLETLSQPLVRALDVPAGALKAGENQLSLSRAPSHLLDDIVVEEIALEPRSRDQALADATVEIAVTDAEARSPIPCRLTLVDERAALAPFHAPAGQSLAVRTGVIYTGDGRARLGVAPGIYVLHATRGFEYSVATQRLAIGAGETKSIALQIRREVPTPELIAADTHIHTLTHSKHGDATLAERMLTIAGEGIEMAVATDHNHATDFASSAADMRVAAHFRSVVGNEVTTKVGHFTAFPVRANAPLPDAQITDWPRLLANIRSTTGAQVITLNHPRDVHSGFIPFARENFDAKTGELLHAPEFACDAIEVVTSAAMQSDPMLLFRDWFALLNYGYRVAAIAASDSHHVSEFILGQARTYVVSRAAEPSAIAMDEVCASFRAGRLLVSFGLLARISVNERFTVGDLATDLGDELRVDVEVLGPSWITADRLELFANGINVREARIPATEQIQKARLTWTLPRPKHDVHLVAIASGPGVTAPFWETPRPYQATSRVFTPRVIGATNPVWIDGDGDGEFNSAREQAAAVIASAAGDRRKRDALLAERDEAVRSQAEDLLRKVAVEPAVPRGLGSAVSERSTPPTNSRLGTTGATVER